MARWQVLLGCVRVACVRSCMRAVTGGRGLYRVVLGRGGPGAQGYQKAFHCSVVEVAVLCSKHFCMWCVMRLQIKKIGAVFSVLSREFHYPS